MSAFSICLLERHFELATGQFAQVQCQNQHPVLCRPKQTNSSNFSKASSAWAGGWMGWGGLPQSLPLESTGHPLILSREFNFSPSWRIYVVITLRQWSVLEGAPDA